MFLSDPTPGGSSGPIPAACSPTWGKTFVRALLFALLAALIGLSTPAHAQDRLGDMMGGSRPDEDSQSSEDEDWDTYFSDPVEQEPVYQPVVIESERTERSADNRRSPEADQTRPRQRPPAEPGEFERFVAAVLGSPLPRFGSTLVGDTRAFAPSTNATIPPDYRINAGDTVSLGLTGSVEGALQLTVDSNGRIFIPRIGAVNVGGVRYGDLEGVLRAAVGREFREFNVSVSVGELRGLRVYVTGFVASPGAYTVSSLSTVVNAVLAAGGPNASGSFRNISLQRNGRTITTLDLYDLLLNGDKSSDVVLQNEDVIFIGPVGDQVAVTGSVNNRGIFETAPGESLDDLLRYAGGPTSIADRDRLLVANVSNINESGWESLTWAEAQTTAPEAGAIIRVLPAVGFSQPLQRQAVLVTIEGEIERPGNYYLPPGSTMADLLAQAGAFSPRAYLFGTRVLRDSIRIQQEEGFSQAISNLELSLAAAPLTDRRVRPGADAQQDQSFARAIIDQLRTRRPDGRIILDVGPGGDGLPMALLLENNDRVLIPPRPVTVGVFGAVFQPGSFAETGGDRIGDYLAKAGGPTQIADQSGLFVVRADGSVLSRQQRGRDNVLRAYAMPGDIIFVPVQTRGNTFLDRVIEVATAIYQVSLGAVGLKVLTE
jgi:protein involved in polysaccharide export with SLBB domain